MKPLFILLFCLVVSSSAPYGNNSCTSKPQPWVHMVVSFQVNPMDGFQVAKKVPVSDLVKAPRHVVEHIANSENIRRAVAGALELGCKPSFLLAHDGIECAWGDSKLCQETNNPGNIKCTCNGTSKRARAFRAVHQRLADAGHPVCIRGFDKIEKSNHYYKVMKDNSQAWAEKIKILRKYNALKKAKAGGYTNKGWCQALENSPYSTDIYCAEKMWAVISQFDLEAIDQAIEKNYCITTDDGNYALWLP